MGVQREIELVQTHQKGTQNEKYHSTLPAEAAMETDAPTMSDSIKCSIPEVCNVIRWPLVASMF